MIDTDVATRIVERLTADSMDPIVCDGHESTSDAIGTVTYCDGTCQRCPDCRGPLAQAFATTAAYVRCRRCGHVFASEA